MNTINFDFESANRLNIFIAVLSNVLKADFWTHDPQKCQEKLRDGLNFANLEHLKVCEGNYSNWGKGPATISIDTDVASNIVSVVKQGLVNNEITKNFSWKDTAIEDMEKLEKLI